jgi:integrase
MATFNYYLRNPLSKEKTPIVLTITSHGVISKISTGETIEPKYWDKKKQEVKRQFTGSPELNEFLGSYLLKAQAVYRNFTSENIQPTTEQLRAAIQLPKKKSNAEFKNALEKYLESVKGLHQDTTIRKYKSLLNHLNKFQEAKNRVLSFETIDLDFQEIFSAFLVNTLKQNNNTVCKYVKALKSFMQWAVDRGFHANMTFKKFKVKEYTVDVVYLTEEELFKIYNLDLSNNPQLSKVRDAFCFGCFTGQRFSDIHRLQWEDIRNETWLLHTKKTKELLEIPLNDFALDIIRKYNGKDRPIHTYSNQKMNDHLKVLAQLAGVSGKHKLVSYNGNKRVEDIKEKHNLICTHTARRTFVTLSLEKGMRPETVMEITGHKDYKTMKRYIKITSKVKETEMKKIWQFVAKEDE